MLTREQAAFYDETGYVRVPGVFSPAEVRTLSGELNEVIAAWATTNEGWTGPWRRAYMDGDLERRSKLTHINDFHLHSGAWLRAAAHAGLVDLVGRLLGSHEVELHHSTLHAKPPETGMPFPVHQDSPFYRHEGTAYVDAVVHVDDATRENGCLRFLAGSHRRGHLEHITHGPDGTPCSPHLPTDRYRLADTVECPAQAGDVVLFSIYTVHGSDINRTDAVRRLVRLGYRDPRCIQTGGFGLDRPGWMVRGVRPPGARGGTAAA